MKIRIIAVLLTLALAAWLPITAQQTAAPQPSAQQAPATPSDTGKTACTCCDHKQDQSSDTAKAKNCCAGKDMDCCKKDGKDSQSAMNCCAGKDGKQCAKKDGKACCGKDGKACCGKDAMACNSKDGKNCCAGTGHQGCCHGMSQS
jgi:hypothetical protein